MSGQMCWLRPFGSDEMLLHLRLKSSDPWQPYTALRTFSVPDYRVPRGSKGWATYQTLRLANWELVPTQEAYQSLTYTAEEGQQPQAA
ncbi:MAG: hypothetical protein B0A82_21150 [Alkalinema sp. CACIAM 70d]|nr:MAG: hypothetical protein B0A82_21150 [Alkalinema sp. CACIAM 70d]